MNDRLQPPLSDSANRHPNRTGTPPLLPPAGTLTLCLLTLLTAVIQSIWDGQQIARALGFDPANFITHPSPNGHEQLVPGWLALFTYVFPHGGWGHVLPNTIALWVFGAFVESNIGTRKFVVSYFVSGAVGALCKILVPPTPEPIAGASLALAGIIGIYAAMRWFTTSRPRRQQLFVLILEIASVSTLILWLTLRTIPAKPDLACSIAYHFLPFLAMWLGVHIFLRPSRLPSDRSSLTVSSVA